MAKTGRNEPCRCGSGLKAKRCCGVTRGPSEDSLAGAFLRNVAREAAEDALALSEREFALLLADLVDLPCLDLSLQVELPKLLSPALGRLCEAIAEDDEIAGDAVIDEVLDELDTSFERAAGACGDRAARCGPLGAALGGGWAG